MKFDSTNPLHQRALAVFVEREVIYCVSHLVSEVGTLAGDGSDYYDDWLSIQIREDYESAATDEGWEIASDSRFGWEFQHCDGDTHISLLTDDEAWRELCDDHGIEPYQREAYEHWIVSNYLADLLEEHGEMISRDFYGLVVWGRCTSGQAISVDGVMWEIANGFDDDHWVCREARGKTAA